MKFKVMAVGHFWVYFSCCSKVNFRPISQIDYMCEIILTYDEIEKKRGGHFFLQNEDYIFFG